MTDIRDPLGLQAEGERRFEAMGWANFHEDLARFPPSERQKLMGHPVEGGSTRSFSKADVREAMDEVSRDSFRERLAVSLYGEYASAAQRAEPIEDLLWKVGEYRRELEDAHSRLDSRGAPRHSESGGVLRLFGRLQWLIDNGQLR